ncbi:MAG TPA: HEAT repeat domain-containing protein [Phycisphaerae bacterium]|nr:HEAT repeat domain-containing protein [Phycisphaerae bacterium]HQL73803.1 HEAT repeat domain-containing protein [Phycisphaerae bacterium]
MHASAAGPRIACPPARTVLLLAAVWFAFSPAAPALAVDASPAPGKPAGDWQTHVAREGYQVEFPPGKIMRQIQGGITIIYALQAGEKAAYLASSTRVPVQDPTPEMMDGIQRGVASKGKIVGSKDLPAQDGMLVRQIVVRDLRQPMVTVDRIMLGRGKIYQVLVVGGKDLSDDPDTQRFFQSFKLLSAQQPEATKPKTDPPVAERPATPRPPRPAPATRPAPRPLAKPDTPSAAETDPISAALEGLKSEDLHQRKAALRKLQGVQVDPKRRVEVAKAIVPMLSESDGFARGDALKTLPAWWTPEVLPDVIKATQDAQFSVRWAAYDALGQMPDERSAKACAEGLATEQGKAKQALKRLGSMAEPAVLKMLSNQDRKVVTAACDVLGEIGTAKSGAALQALTRHKDFFIRSAASRALKKLKERK